MINLFHNKENALSRSSFIAQNSFCYFFQKNYSVLLYIIVIINFSLPSYAQPSFDCNQAQYADEIAICSDPTLSQLDNIANYGYQYLRRSLGKQVANELDQPVIRDRQSCGSNKNCIFQVQLKAIKLFKEYGAPIEVPNFNQRNNQSNNSNQYTDQQEINKKLEQEDAARRQAQWEAENARNEANAAREQANREAAARTKAQQESELARQKALEAESSKQEALQEFKRKEANLEDEKERIRLESKAKDEERNSKIYIIGGIIGGLFAILLYFIPSILAFKKQHEYKWIILVLNIFGGFTGIIWIAVLIWALTIPNGNSKISKEQYNDTNTFSKNSSFSKTKIDSELDAIEKLFELKEKGIINEQEYEQKKKEIVKS